MFEKIKEIIVDKLNIDDDSFITLDTDLMEDLNADSLDAVEIIMDIEDEFDITVEEEDVEQIRTISDIINYIEENNYRYLYMIYKNGQFHEPVVEDFIQFVKNEYSIAY